MNPFFVQNFAPTKRYSFHNKPLVAYAQLSQDGYLSSVSRSSMLRYPYYTVDPCWDQPGSTKPLPENHLQFGPNSQLFHHPVGSFGGLNLIDQTSLPPKNVITGKMKELAEPHQTRNSELTRQKLLFPTETGTLVSNFPKSHIWSDANRMRLLDVFNKNFYLMTPRELVVHDQKRKKIAPDEEVLVQNSFSLTNSKGSKRKKTTLEAWDEPNMSVNNLELCLGYPNAMKKSEVLARSKMVIQEDENGLLKVCSESLVESDNLRKESISSTLIGGSNTKVSLVNKDDEPADLDLTLHL